MPEHFHLLVTEPRKGSLALAMQVLKQRVSLTCRTKEMATWREKPPAFWQPRYYDFNVYTERKHVEKLRYIHRNPVKRVWFGHLKCGAGAASDITGWAKPDPSKLGSEGLTNVPKS